MALAQDIVIYIRKTFPEFQQAEAMALLAAAVIHDESPAEPRLQRCAAIAARGSLQKLHYYIDLLKIDHRDVIVAGEYENVGGTLVHSRDLSAPIPHAPGK